jgi:hypothetical protein
MAVVMRPAAHELVDVKAGNTAQDNAPMLLTLQSAIGQKAGRIAVERALRDYDAGRWKDADCADLSRAPWAPQEGYTGGPVELPTDAIGTVMRAEGWRKR